MVDSFESQRSALQAKGIEEHGYITVQSGPHASACAKNRREIGQLALTEGCERRDGARLDPPSLCVRHDQ